MPPYIVMDFSEHEFNSLYIHSPALIKAIELSKKTTGITTPEKSTLIDLINTEREDKQTLVKTKELLGQIENAINNDELKANLPNLLTTNSVYTLNEHVLQPEERFYAALMSLSLNDKSIFEIPKLDHNSEDFLNEFKRRNNFTTSREAKTQLEEKLKGAALTPSQIDYVTFIVLNNQLRQQTSMPITNALIAIGASPKNVQVNYKLSTNDSGSLTCTISTNSKLSVNNTEGAPEIVDGAEIETVATAIIPPLASPSANGCPGTFFKSCIPTVTSQIVANTELSCALAKFMLNKNINFSPNETILIHEWQQLRDPSAIKIRQVSGKEARYAKITLGTSLSWIDRFLHFWDKKIDKIMGNKAPVFATQGAPNPAIPTTEHTLTPAGDALQKDKIMGNKAPEFAVKETPNPTIPTTERPHTPAGDALQNQLNEHIAGKPPYNPSPTVPIRLSEETGKDTHQR